MITPASTLPAGPRLARATHRDPRLDPIAEKVRAGVRLSLADGDVLYTTPDVWTLCALADEVRRRFTPDAAYYNVNRHFNYSNVCALSCTFCEFHRKQGDPGAYTSDMEQVRAEARKARDAGATEIHSVGGLNPYLPWDYYPELVSTIRDEAPNVHVKAFTAVEVVHLAKIARVFKRNDPASGIRWVLQHLKDAGLGSLPGGGAEVFDDRVHDEAFKGKIRSDVWLTVHRVAHELGLNSNATMLYGHIEQRRERLVHMDMLRRAQDHALARLGYAPDSPDHALTAAHWGAPPEHDWPGPVTLTRDGLAPPTPALNQQGGYFQTIIPLPFFPDGSALEHLPGPSGIENLRTLAVARLMLDNFPHAKAFWIMQTLPMSQLMLQCGADDIDGTVVWYDITHVAGASTHQETSVWDLRRAITEAGFTPVERDTLYRPVTRDGNRWSVAGQQ